MGWGPVIGTAGIVSVNGKSTPVVVLTASDVGAAATVHTHVSTDITDFSEAVDDRVAALVVQGSGITVVYNDAAGTLTISAPAVGVTDGAKGDVTVSAGGTAWTLPVGTVTNAKRANMAANTVSANITGSAAAPADVTLSSFKTWLTLSVADVSGISGTYAPLASAALTGTPTVPTATPGTNTTQIASTAFVAAAVGGLVGSVTSVAGRTGAVVLAVADVAGAAPLASPTFTGTVSGISATMVGLAGFTGLTPATLPLSTAATTANGLLAPRVAPTFTGAVNIPTPTNPADNSTLAATTAWVNAAIAVALGTALPPSSPPTNLGLPAISGSPVANQVLTCSSGQWANATAYTYQWTKDTANISGATGNQYTVVSGDTTHNIACVVSATGLGGTVTALAPFVTVIAAASSPPVNTTPPGIIGDGNVGVTLSVDVGYWTNVPTSYTYLWYRNGAPIPNASAATYLVVQLDAGTSITCLVTGVNGSPGTAAGVLTGGLIINGAPLCVIPPTITGTFASGQTLTGGIGTWSNNPSGFSYQWLRGGVPITGATSPTYLQVTADVGQVITLQVTASNLAGATTTDNNGVSTSGGTGGNTGGSGSGSVSSTNATGTTGVNLTSTGAVDWVALPTSAGIQRKATGGSQIVTSAVGSNSDDLTNTLGRTLTWTDGSPTTSGTSNTGVQNQWATVGSGRTFTFPTVAGVSRTVRVYFVGYSCDVLVTCNASDTSFSPYSAVLSGSSATTVEYYVEFVVTTAATGSVTVSLTENASLGSGGNMHFAGAAILV